MVNHPWCCLEKYVNHWLTTAQTAPAFHKLLIWWHWRLHFSWQPGGHKCFPAISTHMRKLNIYIYTYYLLYGICSYMFRMSISNSSGKCIINESQTKNWDHDLLNLLWCCSRPEQFTWFKCTADIVFNGAPTTNPQNQTWHGRDKACRVEIQRKWMEWGVAN